MPFKVKSAEVLSSHNAMRAYQFPPRGLTNSPLSRRDKPAERSMDGSFPHLVQKYTSRIQVVRPSVKTRSAVCIARGLPTLEMTATH